MGWLLRKLDMLGGAVFAGTAGAATSQLQAFIQQYLQRLGGHLDEARRNYETILNSDRYQAIDAQTRDLIVNDALARVREIRNVHDAILSADIFSKPFAFLTNLDPDVAHRTLEHFTPALPLDMEGIVYSGMGLIIGFIAYEIVKVPFSFLGRKKRRGKSA